MRTFVHIGQHKTATKSIQIYLQKHREELGRRGLSVPTPRGMHGLLNAYSIDGHRMTAVKEELLSPRRRWYYWTLGLRLKWKIARHYKTAHAHGCADVIWSNEGLYLLNSDREYNRLITLLAPYSKKVVAVCCFRDVDSYRQSFKLELEKTGRTDSEEYRDVSENSYLFDYDKKRELLERAFDKTIVFPYAEQDNVGEFFEQIGYPAAGTSGYRYNVTPKPPDAK